MRAVQDFAAAFSKLLELGVPRSQPVAAAPAPAA
jgi:tryptophan synthase alpha subunit